MTKPVTTMLVFRKASAMNKSYLLNDSLPLMLIEKKHLRHLIIINSSSLIDMYLLPLKTEVDFRDGREKIMFWKLSI